MSDSVFDYIIVGAGAAGLMLADTMGKDAYFNNKSILILDKDPKTVNDRTWCFWEKGSGQFDEIVSKKWNHILFSGPDFSKRFSISPYTYKMVRGIDFYSYHINRLQEYENITFRQEMVTHIEENNTEAKLTTLNNNYAGKQVFTGMFDYGLMRDQKKYPVLQQHFIGWTIKTKDPIFDIDQATYMDFSVPQKGNTRFMYVLPFKNNTALVEYTLFSEVTLSKSEYENALKNYLSEHLHCYDYEILETEEGNIPMTCYNFESHNTTRVLNIGTAGGWAKPSTGYSFLSTSKKVPQLIAHLKSEKPLSDFGSKNRFWYYDLLFLDVLHTNNALGYTIFQSLFKKRPPQLIFKFLDENTTLWEDIYYIMGCPKKPFIKAFLNRMF